MLGAYPHTLAKHVYPLCYILYFAIMHKALTILCTASVACFSLLETSTPLCLAFDTKLSNYILYVKTEKLKSL